MLLVLLGQLSRPALCNLLYVRLCLIQAKNVWVQFLEELLQRALVESGLDSIDVPRVNMRLIPLKPVE